MDELKNKRIYLYSHSPKAEEAVKAGEATIQSGGPRRSDGTMLEMAKPLSLTLDELREIILDENYLEPTNKRINRLAERIGLSQEGIQELSKVGWLNNALIGQTYAMTYAGFLQTLSGLERISADLQGVRINLHQSTLAEWREKTEKFLSYLANDYKKLELPKFDVTNSNVDDHLSEIEAFIKHIYNGLMDDTIDGSQATQILYALIFPFAILVKRYSTLFFYENGVPAGSYDRWVDLIQEISSDQRFREKVQYYIRLEADMPFKDRVLIGRRSSKRIDALPTVVAFDADYALYHSKEEYLEISKTVQKLLENPDELPEDGKIYL